LLFLDIIIDQINKGAFLLIVHAKFYQYIPISKTDIFISYNWVYSLLVTYFLKQSKNILMNRVLNIKPRVNLLGATASSLCLVHCLATPLLFTIHTGQLHYNDSHPFWWRFLDIFFLYISLFAVYWSAKNTLKSWMKYALWGSWVLLAVIILNEKLGILKIIEELIYLPSITLILLHLYNRKYCQCIDNNCCVNTSNTSKRIEVSNNK